MPGATADDKEFAELLRAKFFAPSTAAFGSDTLNSYHELYLDKKIQAQLTATAKAAAGRLAGPRAPRPVPNPKPAKPTPKVTGAQDKGKAQA